MPPEMETIRGASFIDIILFADLVLDENNLKIPHPKFHERNFVLLPLIEINNQFIRTMGDCEFLGEKDFQQLYLN